MPRHAHLRFRDVEEVQQMSREETLREAWNQYRTCDHASLRSLYEQLSDATDALHGDGMDGRDEAVHRFYRHRRTAVVMLMRYAAQRGLQAPKWSQLEADRRSNLEPAGGNLSAEEARRYGEHSSVQERRREIHERLKDLCPGFPVANVPMDVKEKLAQDYESVSVAGIEKDLTKLRRIESQT